MGRRARQRGVTRSALEEARKERIPLAQSLANEVYQEVLLWDEQSHPVFACVTAAARYSVPSMLKAQGIPVTEENAVAAAGWMTHEFMRLVSSLTPEVLADHRAGVDRRLEEQGLSAEIITEA